MGFSFVVTVKNKIRAWFKWCLSLLKRDWKLSDYPISVREHEIEPSDVGTRLKQHRYTAQIVNWWVISGGGDKSPKPFKNYKIMFSSVKAEKARHGKSFLDRAHTWKSSLHHGNGLTPMQN